MIPTDVSAPSPLAPASARHSTRREGLVLAGILCVAAFARLYRLDLTWFFLDQARDVSIASSIAAGHAFPLLGPRIGWTGAYLGPLYYYLLAIPFLLAGDPLAGVAFVALSNVVATWFLYRFAREYFGVSVAAYAAAFFAVFPLAIFSSRLVWHTGLLPLFTILFMQALFAVIAREDSRSVIAVLALLAVLPQVHLTAAGLAAAAIVAFVAFRPAVRAVHVAIGAGIFLLLYSPYIAYELSHDLENTRELVRFALDRSLPAQGALLAVLGNVLALYRPALGGFIVEPPWPPSLVAGLSILYRIEASLFVIGIILAGCRLLRHWRDSDTDSSGGRRSLSLLLLWLGLPLLLLGSRGDVIWWYYFDLLYPVQFIFAAIALSSISSAAFLGSLARAWLSRASLCLALAIVVSQVGLQFAFQQRFARHGEATLNVQSFVVTPAASPIGMLTSLSLGHRRGILRALVDEFGVDTDTLRRRVHGPVLGLPAQNDPLVRHFVARRGTARTTMLNPDVHYRVARREGAGSDRHALRARQLGPYVIEEYRPHVDYGTWAYTVVSREALDDRAGQEWRTVEVPIYDLNLGKGRVLLLQGTVDLPAGDGAAGIAVNVTADAPVQILRAQVHGRPLSPTERLAWQIPLMLPTPSGWMMGLGRATESILDLKALEPGRAPMLIAITGPELILKLDVYDAGPL
jgi:Dolichyl-phosphate-mannose-protein mannosyltransferase